ncbi:unannotated protein [freshwater metagenome]|uniref:non-specific serine/threonine protein kinase n=1 Tax=freshwater metagenome TaxID=449393 RepID=A0A6J7JJL7_9ZZZZ
MSAGGTATCAILADDTVQCFNGATPPGDLGTVAQVTMGYETSCAVTTAGAVRCWGANGHGEGTVPTALTTAGAALSVSTGAWHTCAVTADQTPICWGHLDYNSTVTPDVPPGTGAVTQVSAGEAWSCAVTSDSSVVCWGLPGNAVQVAVPDGVFLPPVIAATLTPGLLSFGARAIGAGASAPKTLTLTNTGDAPLTITAIELIGADAAVFPLSGSCAAGRVEVAAGSSCTLLVAFDPSAVGMQAATLRVRTTAGVKPIAIDGSGFSVGTPRITFRASGVTLKTIVRVPTGGTVAQRTTLRRGGTTTTICRTSGKASGAGTVTVTCRIGAATRAALRKKTLSVRVITTFTPKGGSPAAVTNARKIGKRP